MIQNWRHCARCGATWPRYEAIGCIACVQVKLQIALYGGPVKVVPQKESQWAKLPR